ncbi:MAG: hypothetical protein QOI40_3513 [Alphaproteobacteria bacterium]|nr:hypothetical protein [Alphaproteobacteria bacterium]
MEPWFYRFKVSMSYILLAHAGTAFPRINCAGVLKSWGD